MKSDYRGILAILAIFLFLWLFGLVMGQPTKTDKCKEQAIANHYSVSDIEKICNG